MGVEGIENLQPEPVTNNVPEGQEPDPVDAGVDEVLDDGLPNEVDEDAPPSSAVTTHEEDDDPLSNIGDEVSDE